MIIIVITVAIEMMSKNRIAHMLTNGKSNANSEVSELHIQEWTT